MRKNNWTEEELKFLKENYEMMGPILTSSFLGLTKRCVQHKALLLNLKYKNKTTDELKIDFINKAISIHGDKYDYTDIEYINCRTKLKIKCYEHGEFEQFPTSHIIHKQNCPICAKTSLNTETLIKRFINKHGDKYIYDKVKYTGKDCYVTIECKIHGNFTQRYDSHAKGYGCHKCLNSLGEKEIEKYLIENNINFNSQHKFTDCKYKKQLPFDFYLPDYNTCIEFNGKQHYQLIPYWDGDKGLELRQLRDKIKMEYCQNNNIPFIIIKFDEDIIQKLNIYLSNVVYSKPSLVLKNTMC
jgi:hypothetical protein